MGVVPALGDHVKAGVAKATLRVEALLSLTALLALANEDAAADKALQALNVWPQVTLNPRP